MLLYSFLGEQTIPTKEEQQPQTFTSREEAYPKAKSQDFRRNNNKEKGALVVTSDEPGVFVLIDAENEPEAPTSSLSASLYNPPQYPPFVINDIPVGPHTLVAAKTGFIARRYNVTIKEGEISRITIKLEPITQ